jgi:Asp/Glu/hydantoin racemase
MVVHGGKRTYGYAIGILMLEARFPRIPGDMGNAHTFPFPVLYRVVEQANPDRVVRRLDEALLEPFVRAARELEAAGVRAITTNCGFLVRFQTGLAAAVGVPIFTSSLLQVPMIARMLPPGRTVGVLTIDAPSLTAEHLREAGITPEMPVRVVGLEREPHFTDAILNDRLELDPAAAAEEHVAVARRLVEAHPDVAAIVLECTNMPPYAHRIQAATGRPVFDIVTLTRWAHDAFAQRPYEGYL